MTAFAFHKPPDDLESGVGFAGAGCHDQQHALLAVGYGFNGTVDGFNLVIAGFFTASVHRGRAERQALRLCLQCRDMFCSVAIVACGGGNESSGNSVSISSPLTGTLLWEAKASPLELNALGTSRISGITQRLLHAMAHSVFVVFGFDHSNRNTGFPIKDVVSEFFLFLVARRQVAAHDDWAGRQSHFAPDLPDRIPAGISDCRGYE